MANVTMFLGAILMTALLHTSMADNDTAVTEEYTSPFTSALTPLYQMTNGFIRTLFPHTLDNQVIEELNSILSGNNTDYQATVQTVLVKYTGFSACLIIGVILFLVMPWIGLICCCCRLCGKCGGKTLEEDPKNAKCKRLVGSFSLLVFTLIMLGGMIMVFFSGSAIDDLIGKGKVSGDLTRARNDFQSSVDSTFGDVRDEINYWTQTNVLDDKINSFFDAASVQLTDTILNVAAQSDVTEKAQALLNAIGEFNTTVHSLADGMERHKQIIDNTIENLTAVITDVNAIPTTGNVDYSDITALLSGTIDALNRYDFSSVINETQEAKKSFTDLPDVNEVYNGAINKITDSVSQSLNDSKGSIIGQLPNVTAVVDPYLDQVETELKSVLLTISNSVEGVVASLNSDDAKTFSYYVFIGVCVLGSTVGLVVLLLLLGISCGCGERASPDANACNRGRGATCLLAAVGFMFIFFSGLMLLLIVLFVPGALITSQGCHSLEDPDMLTQTVQQLSSLPVEFSQAIEGYSGCLKNRSLGESLNSVLAPTRARINETIENELRNLDIDDLLQGLDFDLSQFEVLPADLNKSLTDLSKFDVTIPSYNDVITAVRYNPIINSTSPLSRAKTLMDEAAVSEPLMMKPRDNVIIQTHFGFLLTQSSDLLVSELQKFTQHTATQNAAVELLAGIEAAKDKINNDQAAVKNETLMKLYNMAKAMIAEVGKEPLDAAFGVQCKDVATSLKTAIDLGCVTIINPYNGLWFSLGWSLAMFIPCICIALCLVRLFRSEFPYNGKDYNHELYDVGSVPMEEVEPYYDGDGGYLEMSGQGFVSQRGRVYPVPSPPTLSSGRDTIPLENKYGNGSFRDDYGNAMASHQVGGGDFYLSYRN